MPKRNNRPYLAAFLLTHADKDHCLGFADLLTKVDIGELWATPRLWRELLDDDIELAVGLGVDDVDTDTFQALRGASFSVYPGEVVALIGDNGAGKSALLKCLSGVYQPDAGEILMNGQPVRLESPLAAMRRGIETVYQDLALADDLEASANLFLGRERLKPGLLRRLGVLDRKKMRETAAAAFPMPICGSSNSLPRAMART